MNRLNIAFYPNFSNGPVKTYLEELAASRQAAYCKLTLAIETLGAEGLRSKAFRIRHMDAGLWELKKSFEGIQYRVFFCISKGTIWLLHAIEKKSAKTPLDDLRMARKRMHGVQL